MGIEMLTCFMALLKPHPENFYPGVNLEFSDRPPALPSVDLKKF